VTGAGERTSMPTVPGKIVWTEVDEAPALATYSLLPIMRKFTGGTGITIETADISLAGRILANFPEALSAGQRVPDALTHLGELAKRRQVSASQPFCCLGRRAGEGPGIRSICPRSGRRSRVDGVLIANPN